MTGQPTPPPNVPPKNKALLRAYQPLVSLSRALLNPYFWGKYVRGGRLTSHDYIIVGEEPACETGWSTDEQGKPCNRVG